MKIAIFIPFLQGGGVGKMMSRVALHLSQNGYEIDLVVGSLRRQSIFPYSENITIVNLESERFIPMLVRFFYYRVTRKPNLIISATSMPNIVAMLTTLAGFYPRSSTIISEREVAGPIMGWKSNVRSRFFCFLSRFCYRRAATVIAVSHGVKLLLISRGGLKKERIEVIYNPVVDSAMAERSTEAVDQPWLYDKSIPVILAVGRLSHEKGFETLIQAVRILNDRRKCRLIILGDGELRSSLADLIKNERLDEAVILPGFKNNPYAYMSRANVFVLPSVHEGFGNVLVEALACGVPVVSTDCPSGPSEILEGGAYGPLVPVGDANALALAIEDQLNNPISADILQLRAKEFSAEAAFYAYCKLVNNVFSK
jgi:glycosyltransferase involved in cell wall biosynthesis